MARTQQKAQFAEITREQQKVSDPQGIAVTVRIGEIQVDVHSGADTAVVETVLWVLQSC